MQWVMGLMSTDEIGLRLKHRELLNQRADQKRSAERDHKTLETLRPGLWEKLGLSDDADVAGGQATFDLVKPTKEAAGQIASLEDLKAERHAKSRVPELKKQRDAVQERVNDAEANIRTCRNMITYFEKQITEFEKDPLRQFAKCQADPCWIREKARHNAKSLTTADGEIDSSLKTPDVVRSRQRSKIDSVSEVYEQILQRVFGADAKGRIQVDGNGLLPVPDKSLAPDGAAISVMASVLVFDITCVAASITGVGYHPRFLMHDSPREGDMEGPLFSKLFKIVYELESLFAEGKPSFQYIATTTTPPPQQFADEDGPFVCLTLDARIDNEKLLRAAY